MPAVFRPRRSLLYMPGSNPRALEKARALPADGLIIDLEDAVAAGGEGGRSGDCRGGASCRRVRLARAGAARQSARHPLGPCRSRRRGDNADRCGAAAQSRERGPGAADRVAARCAGGAGTARSVVHDRNASRRPRGARDRRGEPQTRRTRSRHFGPDQGIARSRHPRSPAADHLARPGDARCARLWAGDPRRGPSRSVR